MIRLTTPLSDKDINKIHVGDMITITGIIYCGRDAVLPKIISLLENGNMELMKMLNGSLIFHTAVSDAGIGPTSSNKLEIESSIIPLSSYGVKIHLGKGQLHSETISGLNTYNSIYCIIPPVTALLNDKTISKKIIMFPELGMEAFYQLEVKELPVIVGAAHGVSIYE